MGALAAAKLEFGRLQFPQGKLRLYFAEFQATGAGQRVFDVLLQGKTVIRGLDIFKEVGSAKRALIREMANVEMTGEPVDWPDAGRGVAATADCSLRCRACQT